jgi:hypothetical protein
MQRSEKAFHEKQVWPRLLVGFEPGALTDAFECKKGCGGAFSPPGLTIFT